MHHERLFDPGPFSWESENPGRSGSRFVILTHDYPFLHWDLMLEEGDSLMTFRLLKEPARESVIPADPLPRHRIAYLDYEGPVSGDRGTVIRWDRGTCQLHEQTESRQVWFLNGSRISARVTLSVENGHWTCRFEDQ